MVEPKDLATNYATLENNFQARDFVKHGTQADERAGARKAGKKLCPSQGAHSSDIWGMGEPVRTAKRTYDSGIWAVARESRVRG